MSTTETKEKLEGILLIDKPTGRTSFSLIPKLRFLLKEKKIGHGGTLDPLATGVMVYLVGRKYTKTASSYLLHDKEYVSTFLLGEERDSYDVDGEIIDTSKKVPEKREIEEALLAYQGSVLQTPPMYSAKKVNGKKLYELAREGKTIERKSKRVQLKVDLISYNYPHLEVKINCSSGTYVRSIAHDLGNDLGCFACVEKLQRTRSGSYTLENCITLQEVEEATNLGDILIKTL